ncbi:MAG: DinB family protein [Cyclobacteriaceae bacterium]
MQNPPLISSNQTLFSQLTVVLTQLSEHDYQRPLQILRNGTIGQHVRHILEFYQALIQGAPNRRICYDDRARASALENNMDVALQTIQYLTKTINSISISQPLVLVSKLDKSGLSSSNTAVQSSSSVGRELLYCLEHAIHHMAIIRIGIEQTWPKVVVVADFGVAPSTIRHQQQCAP